MRKKKIFMCALLMGCVLLSACGNSSVSDGADSKPGTSAAETDGEGNGAKDMEEGTTEKESGTIQQMFGGEGSETVTGMLQSVKGSMITLAVMNMPGGNMQGGMRPELSNGEMQGGEWSELPSGEMQGGEWSELPSGEMQGGEWSELPSGEMQGGERPELPSGEMQGGERPELPSGDMMGGKATTMEICVTSETSILDASGNVISLENLNEAAMIIVQLDEEGNASVITVADMSTMGVPGGNMQSAPVSYDALHHYNENADVSGESISSTDTDENAVLVSDGATVTLNQVSLDRISANSTGGDASSFYGIGAAVLTTDGTVTVTNSSIETDAAGAAGVFAYNDGVAYVSDTIITTKQNTSGGIHVAGGGTLYASNLTIETNGESAAAIRSDRGGGVMTVEGGTYTSNGSGSPAVYCTADILVEAATLTATASEAVCIEGLNTLVLTDCDLSGNMPDLAQNDCTWTVILYQSMSGDSEIGNSTFTMNGGSLTSRNGGLFYTTNTESTFYLSEVDITYADDCEFFLKCTGNQNQRGWGQSGANGADCSFTASAQEMEGNILWDSISTLDFVMENGSVLTGAFLQDESAAGKGGTGYAKLSIDETSVWIVTADSILGTLTCEGTIVDANQNSVTIQGTDGTVYVKGTSPYTITVSAYAND